MIGPMPAHPDRLVRTDAWAGVRAGEPVEVAGTRMRGARWTFLAHVRNRVTGEEWIEVVGGRGDDRTLRSFRPDQVYPAAGRPASPGTGGAGTRRTNRRPAPSLAQAPRLPLGPAEP